jgi:hypothetical protein
MDEIREKRTVIHEAPVGRRPVVETQYDHTVQEREGLSGGAIAAMVITAVIAAIFITWLILNNQQSEDLAMERERALIAERNAAQAQAAQQQPQQQPQQQQPNVIVLPQTQPSTVPVPVPVPSQAEPATAPTPISVEVDVNRKLLDDKQLGSYPITAKIENGTVTLSGNLPNEDLKTRAEKVVSSVRGVRRVINEITVQ